MLSSINETESDAYDLKARKIRMTGIGFAIVDKYKDLVYRTALTITGNTCDAEDVMQEVFFKYFRAHPQFDSDAHERSWIVSVTLNTGKNLIRSPWYRNRADVDPEEIPNEKTHAEQKSPVLNAVLSLPEKYRVAIYLHYYEGYSIREIAVMTKKTEAATAQYLARGRAKLRKKLGGVES